jgi:hypothetical protein
MVGTGKDHSPDSMLARGLVEVERSDDVGLQDRLKRSFDRVPAQVDDGVDAADHVVHRSGVCQIRNGDFFPVARGAEVLDVRQPQDIAILPQPFTQHLAEATGGTGEQKSLVHLDRHCVSSFRLRKAAGHPPQLCYIHRQSSDV